MFFRSVSNFFPLTFFDRAFLALSGMSRRSIGSVGHSDTQYSPVSGFQATAFDNKLLLATTQSEAQAYRKWQKL